MRAWIVTWECAGDAAAVADTLAAILPARWRSERVAMHVEFLYALTQSTAEELARHARSPTANPCRAQSDECGWITCGSNPILSARPAFDVTVAVDGASGLETIRWTTCARRRMVNDRVVEVVPPREELAVRRIRGPLSSMPIWDRENARFMPGWGPGETPTGPAAT